MTGRSGNRLKILFVAYPFATVGPDAAGGAEQVLFMLEASSASGGAETAVAAHFCSSVSGRLFGTVVPDDTIVPEFRELIRLRHRATVLNAVREFRPDLVHMHGLDFLSYLPGPEAPVLATLHLPPSWYPEKAFRLARPDLRLNCVSKSQAESCPPCGYMFPYVTNGVPVESFAVSSEKEQYALCLGRICPEKNYHEAFEAGTRSGIPVYLGGKVYPYEEHERYFDEKVVPLLDGVHRFLGPVGFERKRELLARAGCLLIPSRVNETSSLTAMEALASGTPVIAYPSGALPEIIDHGVTGFLVDGVEDMARAMKAVGGLSPDACRDAAVRRFSFEKTAAGYLELYSRLLRECRHG